MTAPAVVARLRAAGCVFAEDEARLLVSAARTPAELTAMVDRRAAGVPLEHVLGWAEFCGSRIVVAPGVFVPRRRTAFLVEQVTAVVRSIDRVIDGATDGATDRAIVVDLCCGSGAVAAAVGAAVDGLELHAVDIDPAAVRCARRNLAPLGGRAYEGDLDQPLPATLRGRVDVLVANAPYVPTNELGLLPPEARIHEPRAALDGGSDGLDIVRRVCAAAPRWLAPGGHVLLEISDRQIPATVQAMARHGLSPRVARADDLDATVAIGRQR